MKLLTPKVIAFALLTMLAAALLAGCGSADDSGSDDAGSDGAAVVDDSILTELPQSKIEIDGTSHELISWGIDPEPFGPATEPVIFGSDDEDVSIFITVDLKAQAPTGEVLVVNGGQVAQGNLDMSDMSDMPVLVGAGTLNVVDEEGEPSGETVEVKLEFRAFLGSSSFELDGNRAIVRGELGELTTRQVQHLIDHHPEVDTLVMADIGGSVDDDANMVTGRLVRDAGYDTVVPSEGQIYSGGVDLFAAGNERTVDPGAVLGVHSWCCGPNGEDAGELDRADPAHAGQLAYFEQMLDGTGRDFYFFTIDSAPFGDIHSMTAAEVNTHGLSTNETTETGIAPDQEDDSDDEPLDEGLVLGDGLESSDDDCKIVGESELTAEFLDEGQLLAACPAGSDRVTELTETFGAIVVAEDVEGYDLLAIQTGSDEAAVCSEADAPVALVEAACPTGESPWSQVDDTTIALNGVIGANSLAEFEEVFDDKVTTVIVNSSGGDTLPGVQIGQRLRDAGVHVIVDRYCLSSCANYLFTAGETKEIRDGLVAFHGNTIAVLSESPFETWAELVNVPDGQEAAYATAIEDLERTEELEARFFEQLGISQDWFELSQRGGPEGNLNFLAPTVATMAQLNIGDVTGEQSGDAIEELKRWGEGENEVGLYKQ